jgi:RNA polymerase sigma-70 factor (ECF subfamily)
VHEVSQSLDADRRASRKIQPPVSRFPETADPLAVDEAALLAQCVRPFVDELPDIYRDALVMTELDGLTQAAAANRVGISLSGMKSRVQRGRAMLRDSIEDCCEVTLDARNGIRDVTPCEDC